MLIYSHDNIRQRKNVSKQAVRPSTPIVHHIFWGGLFIIVLVAGIWAYAYELSLPALGFHWTSAGIVYAVIPGSAGERAGVQVGDRFWLDGVRVENTTAFNEVLNRLQAGQTVEVEVERGDEVVALPLTPTPNTITLEGWLVDYLVGLTCWLSGWLVRQLSKRSPISQAYQAFALILSLLFFTLRPSPAHFRTIEYICFGLVPGAFLWFFLTLLRVPSRQRWLWAGIGGGPGIVAGVANAILVFMTNLPPFNWPYLILNSSLAWGALTWLVWLFFAYRNRTGEQRTSLQETAFKILILTAPFLGLLFYTLFTTWKRGTTMLLHFSAIGFPLSLTIILLEGEYRPLLNRISKEILIQLPLQIVAQLLFWSSVVLLGGSLHIYFSWDALVLTSFLICLLTLFIPWLHMGLRRSLSRIPK